VKIKRLLAIGFVAVVCLLSTACISLEEEVFLNPDGSGEFVLHLAMPDFPESVTKNSAGSTPQKSPEEELANLKKQLTSELPATITVKQMKEVRQNGSMGFYGVFQFKNIRDIEPALAKLGKSDSKGGGLGENSQWHVALDKIGGKNVFTSTVFMEMQDDKKGSAAGAQPAGATPGGADKPAGGMDNLDEQLKPLLMGMIRMRFTLHTPAKITETNADIVLHDNIAVWDSSMIAFYQNKKPMQMKAVY
jgi:hypothetical protein